LGTNKKVPLYQRNTKGARYTLSIRFLPPISTFTVKKLAKANGLAFFQSIGHRFDKVGEVTYFSDTAPEKNG